MCTKLVTNVELRVETSKHENENNLDFQFRLDFRSWARMTSCDAEMLINSVYQEANFNNNKLTTPPR